MTRSAGRTEVPAFWLNDLHSFSVGLEIDLTRDICIGLRYLTIRVLRVPRNDERLCTALTGTRGGCRVDLGMNMPLASQVPDAGIAVGIGGFRRIDNLLNLGRLTRLDGHRQSENPLGTGLDATGIDPRLNQPAPWR